jgi:hypothetical protein
VTAETNLQHCDRLPYALPAASYNALRDSVPPFALLGSNGGGLPRAAPCSAGVDIADGFPVCVHLLVSVVDAPVRPCYRRMSAVKPVTSLKLTSRDSNRISEMEPLQVCGLRRTISRYANLPATRPS